MTALSACGCFKHLTTTHTVKVIHSGLEEQHLFTLICHTDIHWEDVQLRHINTHTVKCALYLLCRLQDHILQTETCVL